MYKKILVFETDQHTLQTIQQAFTNHPYSITIVSSVEKCLLHIQEISYDFFLFNLSLLGDVKNLLTKVKEAFKSPCIAMTGFDGDPTFIHGLKDCVADFIRTPLSEIELITRLKFLENNGQNHQATEPKILKMNQLTLNEQHYEAYRLDKPLGLTKAEFMILNKLMSNPNKVLTKDELFEAVWQEEYLDNPNSLNVHIHNLRKKIEIDYRKPKYIMTRWGIGYAFVFKEEKKSS
jgi:two-component system, OmpR family, response regulator VanR